MGCGCFREGGNECFDKGVGDGLGEGGEGWDGYNEYLASCCKYLLFQYTCCGYA